MQLQLRDLEGPKRHKWVAIDLNTKFANIDSIKQAVEEAEEIEVKRNAKEPKLRPQRVLGRKARVNMLDST